MGVLHRIGVVEPFKDALLFPIRQCAILSDDSVDRPLAGDEIAPAGGSTGDGNHLETGITEIPETLIRLSGEFSFRRDRVINVKQHVPDMGSVPGRKFTNRLHRLIPLSAPLAMIVRT